MYYKVSATIELRGIINACNAADAIDKAEAVFKRELVKLENSPIDPKYIKAEPFDFMNAKINISRGGPLSGEY